MPDDYPLDLLAVNRDIVRLEEILAHHSPEMQVRMLAQMLRLRSACADFAQHLRIICADFARDLAQKEGGGRGGSFLVSSASKNGLHVGQLQEKTGETTAISTEAGPGFEEFWALYPRKKDKNRAQRAFAHALRKACASAIIDGLRNQCASMRMRIAQGEAQFIPHPTTWLNNERWADEPEPAPTAVMSSATQKSVTAVQSWLRRPDVVEAPGPPRAALEGSEGRQ